MAGTWISHLFTIIDSIVMEIIETRDGSHTVRRETGGELYHSIHGALAESRHVFIAGGLSSLPAIISPVRVLEVGFGTGLNVLLTWHAVKGGTRRVHYVALEPYPLSEEEVMGLNYPQLVDEAGGQAFFRDIHRSAWNTPVFLDEHFILNKVDQRVQDVYLKSGQFHLVYFDAFSYDNDPGIWSREIMEKLHESLAPGGVIVTYSAKGEVRRNMESAGLRVERLPGAPGKREMLRARKG